MAKAAREVVPDLSAVTYNSTAGGSGMVHLVCTRNEFSSRLTLAAPSSALNYSIGCASYNAPQGFVQDIYIHFATVPCFPSSEKVHPLLKPAKLTVGGYFGVFLGPAVLPSRLATRAWCFGRTRSSFTLQGWSVLNCLVAHQPRSQPQIFYNRPATRILSCDNCRRPCQSCKRKCCIGRCRSSTAAPQLRAFGLSQLN